MNGEGLTLLLVEDNEDDVFIFKRAFKGAQLACRLQIVGDGQAAIDYVAGKGDFADRTKYPPPFLVLLDLKLPVLPGLDVLRQLRSEAALANVSVMVLTSSAEPRDIIRAHEWGAWAFLVKPPTPRMLAEAVASVATRPARENGDERPRIHGDMLAKIGE